MQLLLVDLLKDIFLILLLGENNKPRLDLSTIEKLKALLRCFFIYSFFTPLLKQNTAFFNISLFLA
jgi:hypothetical protein